MTSESKTSKRRIAATDRQRQALELRKAGVGFVRIAEQLGYAGPAGAYKAVMTALKKTLVEPAADLRELELKRLDDMLLALWPQIKQGSYGATDRVLRIMERRAKLLGLDAKQSLGVTTDGDPIQLVIVQRQGESEDNEG